MTFASTLTFSIVAGILSCAYLHQFPIRGDVGLVLALSLSVLQFSIVAFLDDRTSSWSSFISSLKTMLLYFSTIIASTTLFRLSPWHPLKRFPGPLLNKITSLQSAYIVHRGHRHLVIAALHKKFGKIVRTGPNTLSINSHAAVAPIYMNAAALSKSSAYEYGGVDGKGLFFIQGKEEHSERRRQWARGFSSQSLQNYKHALDKRTSELMDCLSARRDANGVINLSDCLEHWSYDFMGDVIFGNCNELETMRDGDPEELIQCGKVATMIFEVLGEVPSLFHILWHLPVTERMRRLETYAGELMMARQKAGIQSTDRDLASHLLDDSDPSLRKLSPADLRADALFAIQAGSETPTGALTHLLFFLLSHPDVHNKLKAELVNTFPNHIEYFPAGALDSLPYLNAVVQETLRLGSVFGGFPRVVPPEGAILDGEHIPGGTIVSVPTYAQHISEENFWPEPLSFKPERWLPGGLGPGSRTNKAAILAFSCGPFGCLGKGLAVQELLIVPARILLTYDIAFSPKFDSDAFISGVTNLRATNFAQPLTIVATER